MVLLIRAVRNTLLYIFYFFFCFFSFCGRCPQTNDLLCCMLFFFVLFPWPWGPRRKPSHRLFAVGRAVESLSECKGTAFIRHERRTIMRRS